MLHVLAVLFALLAVACMVLALGGMVSGHSSARMGWLVRVLALIFFAAAVALNVAAH